MEPSSLKDIFNSTLELPVTSFHGGHLNTISKAGFMKEENITALKQNLVTWLYSTSSSSFRKEKTENNFPEQWSSFKYAKLK